VFVRFSVFVYRQRPCDELITRARSPTDCLRSIKLKLNGEFHGQGPNWGCSAKEKKKHCQGRVRDQLILRCRTNALWGRNCSKPSIIRLQLIRMSDNENRNMKNWESCSQLNTRFKRHVGLGARGIRARGLSDCVEGSWRDWIHPDWLELDEGDPGFQLLTGRNYGSDICCCLFSSVLSILFIFPFIYFLSFFFLYFRIIFCFIKPDHRLIRTTLQINPD
jgi:hypothetical protein